MKQRSRRPKRKDTQVPQSTVPSDNVADEAVNEEMDDSLVRVATIATSLDAEQDRGNINKTRSKATFNEPSSPGTSSGSVLRCQKTMGDTIAQTRFENVSKHSNDPLLARDGDDVIVESIDVVNTAEETRSVVEEVTAVTILVSAATTTTTTTTITDVEITLAQALAELKSAKPKADKVVTQEPEQGITTTTPKLTTTTVATTIIADSIRPKAKGIVFHER
ncbi:hypothetical protein Tco_0060366 [Tanacetum coccineum]